MTGTGPQDPLLGTAVPGHVMVAGDWHMNRVQGCLAVREGAGGLPAPRVILQLGDFGIWPGEGGAWYLAGLNRALAAADATLAFIDGNHEDHDFLASVREGMDPLAPAQVSDNIWHLPRGYRWTWHGREWLALGGAASPDRAVRLRWNYGWSPGEYITAADLARAGSRPAAVMITHEAPGGAPVRYLDPPPSLWLGEDLDKGEEQRAMVRQVAESVQARWLFHGHHHQGYRASVPLRHGPLEVTGLDMDGSPGNWGILDTRTMTWSSFGPGECTLERRRA